MIKGLAERAEKIRAGGLIPMWTICCALPTTGGNWRWICGSSSLWPRMTPMVKYLSAPERVPYLGTDQRKTLCPACILRFVHPTTDGSFSVYDDLKKKLMDAGIPEEEIAFIHTADSEAKKKELFSKVRAGQVRVLLGSTAKMGAGTNVQDKLIAPA